MKKILALLLVIMLLLSAGIAWVLMSFHIIEGQLYSKNADFLNLQKKNISISHYESLAQRLPGCEILWNVPFQGEYHSSDAEELVLKDLETDLDHLAYFPNLKTLDARNCADLSGLNVLRQLYPEVTVLAEITLNGKTYAWDAEQIELSAITAEELELLPCLTNLKQVTVGEGGNAANFPALKEYCENNGIDFRVIVFGSVMEKDVAEISVSGVTENQIQLLSLCPWLKKLHLPEPEVTAQALLALKEAMPETEVTWEKTVLGLTFQWDETHIDLMPVLSREDGADLSEKSAWDYGLQQPVMCDREEVQSSIKVTDAHPLPDRTDATPELIAELEAAMPYFPEAQTLTLVGCWLENEAISQFRETHREDYKVIWSVQIGNLATRTDATLFMPTKFMVTAGSIADWHAYNLRYCEDMISMDVGHMSLSELEFLEFMPDLLYLDIALNHIVDLSPLASCKNLKFLVMHSLSMELDYTPLLGCTALEDLHIGNNPGDISPVFEMKQLKNLWITGLDYETYERAKAELPDTHIGYFYNGTNDGWRRLPNYFKMRDALLMFYMQ